MDDAKKKSLRDFFLAYFFFLTCGKRRQLWRLFNEKIKLGIFFDFWRRAAHRRQKSKKMRNEKEPRTARAKNLEQPLGRPPPSGIEDELSKWLEALDV